MCSLVYTSVLWDARTMGCTYIYVYYTEPSQLSTKDGTNLQPFSPLWWSGEGKLHYTIGPAGPPYF